VRALYRDSDRWGNRPRKTSGCTYPFAEGILAFRHDDPEKRISGLIPEVKGDSRLKARQMLGNCRRAEDYVELSLYTRYRHNPFHNGERILEIARKHTQQITEMKILPAIQFRAVSTGTVGKFTTPDMPPKFLKFR
jgi:hypothetical protein